MGHRSRRHRQRFSCGHRGFGQYCHRCTSQEILRQKRRERRRSVQESQIREAPRQAQCQQCPAARQHWQQSFATDPVDLSQLPRGIVLKARLILARLAAGAGFWQVLGKRMRFDRGLIRIPVGHRYRLLCRRSGDRLWPLRVMSHETYNRVVRNQLKL